MISDIRFALRQFAKSPGFTLVAVLTLALGLSANISLFGIIDFVFFQPLPVKNPGRLVYVTQRNPGVEIWSGYSWADYRDIRTGVPEFEDALALFFTPADIAVPGAMPEHTWIECVSGNYFSMLGIQPAVGRLFLPGEGEKPGADPIVVISYDYWQTNLGGDRAVVGRPISINGKMLTVVGVTPPTFHSAQWALAPRAFVPATMSAVLYPGSDAMFTQRNWNSFKVLAALKSGVGIHRAEASLQVVARRLDSVYRKGEPPSVVSLHYERLSRPDPGVAGPIPFVAVVFSILVGLVLLIACANVANLQLARSAARRRELGIRSAVGATRGRLLRQLITESVLLGLFAGIFGLLLSQWLGPLIARLAPQSDVPTAVDASFNWGVVWFTAVVSVVAGVATGLMPALKASAVDVLGVIRGSDEAPGRVGHWFRNLLVITQVAFSVVVLVAGGLFLRTLFRLSSMNLGFRSDHTVMASVDLKLHGYDDAKSLRFARELSDKLNHLPKVVSASYGSHIPFDTTFESLRITPESALAQQPATSSVRDELVAGVNHVGPEFLETLGVSLLEGRSFSVHDDASSTAVAIVNQSLARHLWPNQSPLGKRIRLDGGALTEVVGVVADGKYLMLSESARPYVFVPLAQSFHSPLTFIIHSSTSDSAALIPEVRRLVRQMDATLPIYAVRSVSDHVKRSALGFMPLRMGAVLSAAQGVLGLVLAVMGLYAVVAFTVAQRTREIGIRIALGAGNPAVLSLVLGTGMRLSLIGMGVGVLLSLAMATLMSGILFGLNPIDFPVYASVVGLIGGIAFVACYVPARKAMRVDPIVALRTE